MERRKRRQAIEEPNKNNAYARVRFEGGQTASESQGNSNHLTVSCYSEIDVFFYHYAIRT